MRSPPLHLWVVRRIGLAIIAALALAIATGIELNASGGLPGPVLILLAIIIGILGPAESIARTVREWRADVSFETKLSVEEAAKGAIVALELLQEAPNLSWKNIGVTVFVPRRTLRHPIRGIQERIVRIRMPSYPPPTTVKWTWEKGILGKCWKDERDAPLNHRGFYAPYMEYNRKQWDALDNKVRMNLSFRDFVDIRDYGLVYATPMKDRHGYHGCFVVQVPSEHEEEIKSDAAKEVMRTSAAVTCAVLCRGT